MRRKITIEVLELLDTIDKKGSFSAAADALFKAPSAITYAVQKLESDLEVELFKKKGRKVEMTPAARVLLEQGREILNSISTLQQTVIETDSGWEPKLDIAVNTILGVEYVYPEVKELYKIRPNIEVNLHEEAFGGLWEAVNSDRVDVAIGASGQSGHPTKGLELYNLGHINIHLISPPDHPLAKLNRQLTNEDLLAYRFVVVRDSVKELNPRPDVVLSKQPVIRVPTIQDKLHAIIDGLGIGFLPDVSIKYFAKSKNIVVLPYGKGNTPMCNNLYVIWKKHNQGKALKWLSEKLKQKTLDEYKIY